MALHGGTRRAALLGLSIMVAACSSGGRPAAPASGSASRSAPPAVAGRAPAGSAPGAVPPSGPRSTGPSRTALDAFHDRRPPSARRAPYGRWGAPVLADAFRGNRLDTRKWHVYDAPGAASHPGSPAGVHVAHGRLVLVGGLYKGRDESAGVVSRLAQTYGRWEARIKADRGAGYAATAFLWPTRLGAPEWSEIDFAEIMDPTRRTGGLFIHHGRRDRQLMKIAHVDFTRWHTVALDWLPSHLTFWVDGRPVWTYRGPYVPHRADMHLNLRNEIIDGYHRLLSTPRRVTMQVDWIRVFRAPGGGPRR